MSCNTVPNRVPARPRSRISPRTMSTSPAEGAPLVWRYVATFRLFLENGDGSRPARGGALHLHREARDGEAMRRQHLEIVQLLDVAVADLAPGLVPFPDHLHVLRRRVALRHVLVVRVPGPAVGAGDAHAAR